MFGWCVAWRAQARGCRVTTKGTLSAHVVCAFAVNIGRGDDDDDDPGEGAHLYFAGCQQRTTSVTEERRLPVRAYLRPAE